MKRTVIFAVQVLAFCSTAFAAEVYDHVTINGEGEPVEFVNGRNLDRCLEYDRLRKRVEVIPPQECAGFRRYYTKQAEQEEKAHIRAEENRMRQEEFERERVQVQKQKEQDRKDADARFEARQAAEKAEREREEAESAKAEHAAQKRQDAKIAELKLRCGSDYKNPTIGMRIERLQECVSPVKLTGQVNRTDGVASVYSYGPLWVNVMSGRVVAWGR